MRRRKFTCSRKRRYTGYRGMHASTSEFVLGMLAVLVTVGAGIMLVLWTMAQLERRSEDGRAARAMREQQRAVRTVRTDVQYVLDQRTGACLLVSRRAGVLGSEDPTLCRAADQQFTSH